MAKKNELNAWMISTIIFAALLLLSLVWNGVLTVMLVQGGGGGFGSGSDSGQVQAPTQGDQQQPSQPKQPSGPVDVSADDDPVMGDADAPVEIIEFSDYECPFCGRFFSDSLPQIKENYIDTGKAKLVYRDFPLSFHPRAKPSAIAAECVDELADDETYFEFHDLVFENQKALSDSDLQGYAEQVGVDSGDFASCYADEDGSMAAEVEADVSDGRSAGVSGTPTVFINGKKIVGAQPYNVFKSAIEEELN